MDQRSEVDPEGVGTPNFKVALRESLKGEFGFSGSNPLRLWLPGAAGCPDLLDRPLDVRRQQAAPGAKVYGTS